jgi:hypothetical protein
VKKILIYPISKKVEISDKLHGILCVYKIFWPPETTVKLGKKVIALKDFTPWPPPEQVGLGLDVPVKEVKRKTDMS